MELIVTEFVPDIQAEENTAGYTDGDAQNIDNSIELILPKVSPRNFKIAFEHDSKF